MGGNSPHFLLVLYNWTKLPLASLFILAFYSYVSFAVCTISDNESMQDLIYFPEEMPISCNDQSWLYLWFSDSRCLGAVDALCVESVIADTSSLEISITNYAERAKLTTALDLLSGAAGDHNEAKEKKEELLVRMEEEIVRICNITLKLPIISSIFSLPCKIDTTIYDGSASFIVEKERSALEGTSRGMNAIIDLLKTESDELYCAGADYENYSGAATATYAKLRDFVRIANQKMEGDRTDRSRRWSAVLSKTWALNDFERKGITKCSPAYIISETLNTGLDTIAFSAVELYREIVSAKEAMISEYQSIERDTKRRLDAANAELQFMKAQQYQIITEYDVDFLVSRKRNDSLPQYLAGLPVPVASLTEIYALLNSSGFEKGAAQIYADAAKTFAQKDEFYAAKAMEQLTNSRALLTLAEDRLNDTKESISDLTSTANELAAASKAVASAAVEGYVTTDDITLSLREGAKQKINEADQIIVTLQSKKIGEQVKEYIKAIIKYDEATTLLIEESEIIVQIRRELNSALNLFEGSEKRASTDGLDTSYATIAVDSIRDQITSNDIKSLLIAKSTIENATTSLYNSASLKYYYLSDERMVALAHLSLLETVDTTGANELRKQLSSYDRFFDSEEETYIPSLTIGSYKRIDALFNDLEGKIASKKVTALSNYLSGNAKVTKLVSGKVVVDKTANVVYNVQITNDLDVNSTEAVTVHVKGVGGGPNSQVTKPSGTTVAFKPGGIDILFSSIEPLTTYQVEVSSEVLVAETTSKSEQTQLFDKNELKKRYDLKVKSSEQIAVFYTTSTQADDCRAYEGGAEIPLTLNDSELSVEIGASVGANSFYIICRTLDPVTIKEYDQTITPISDYNSEIDYTIGVSSNIGYVEGFKAEIIIPGNVTASSIAVYDTDGRPADSFKFVRYGTNYIASWKVPILTNEEKLFYVSYELNDTAGYLRDLVESIGADAGNESINVDSYLDSATQYISSGSYTDALKKLREAQKKIDTERNLRIDKNALTERLTRAISSFRAATDNPDEFTTLGWPTITIELNKKINEFNTKKKAVEAALKANNTKEASKLLGELEDIAAISSVDTLMYGKSNEVFKKQNELKSEFFKLNNVVDVKEYIDELDSLDSSVSSIAVAISDKRYFDAASLLANISSRLSEFESVKKNKTAQMMGSVISMLKEIKDYETRWKTARKKLSEAINISIDNPGKNYIAQATDIESTISMIDKAISNSVTFYDAFKKTSIDTVTDRIDEIRIQREELNSIGKQISGAESVLADYKLNADAAIKGTTITLSSKGKTASKDDVSKLQLLSNYLVSAKKSFDTGNYLNSMAYIGYITQKLNETGNKGGFGISIDPMVILAVILAIAATVAALFLMRMKKEKPEEPRALKRID